MDIQRIVLIRNGNSFETVNNGRLCIINFLCMANELQNINMIMSYIKQHSFKAKQTKT